jgi:hypothetical protein
MAFSTVYAIAVPPGIFGRWPPWEGHVDKNAGKFWQFSGFSPKTRYPQTLNPQIQISHHF